MHSVREDNQGSVTPDGPIQVEHRLDCQDIKSFDDIFVVATAYTLSSFTEKIECSEQVIQGTLFVKQRQLLHCNLIYV